MRSLSASRSSAYTKRYIFFVRNFSLDSRDPCKVFALGWTFQRFKDGNTSSKDSQTFRSWILCSKLCDPYLTHNCRYISDEKIRNPSLSSSDCKGINTIQQWAIFGVFGLLEGFRFFDFSISFPAETLHVVKEFILSNLKSSKNSFSFVYCTRNMKKIFFVWALLCERCAPDFLIKDIWIIH